MPSFECALQPTMKGGSVGEAVVWESRVVWFVWGWSGFGVGIDGTREFALEGNMTVGWERDEREDQDRGVGG